MSNLTIEIWFVNLAADGRDIWERDIERIENELIKWLKERDQKNLPGDTALEGTSSRQFTIHFEATGEPLPAVHLLPGRCEDTRAGSRRKVK